MGLFLPVTHYLDYYNFIYLAALGLHCARAFSSWGERASTLCCRARASHCGGLSLRSMSSRRMGFSSCGAQAQ